jgi:hypothetical protein
MNALRHVALAGIVGLACAAPAAAQSDFEWRGQMAQGQGIEIKGINGNVRAVAARGNEVEVTATRTARRSNPADVRFEVVPHAGGVTILRVYPAAPASRRTSASPDSGGRIVLARQRHERELHGTRARRCRVHRPDGERGRGR